MTYEMSQLCHKKLPICNKMMSFFIGRSNTTETTLNIQFWENHHWQMKYYITPMFISLERSWYINSHDFHWGCRSASLIEGALPCDLPTVGVMGVRKQSMNCRCLQLARWRLEYNPLWGEGVLAGPLHSALMWAPFNISLTFWAEVPPLLNGGILKRLPPTLNSTNVFARNNVKAWEQTELRTALHSILTSTTFNKPNGKQLCRQISLLRNKCDTMITTIFVNWTICNKIPSLGTCVVSLIAKSYGAI